MSEPVIRLASTGVVGSVFVLAVIACSSGSSSPAPGADGGILDSGETVDASDGNAPGTVDAAGNAVDASDGNAPGTVDAAGNADDARSTADAGVPDAATPGDAGDGNLASGTAAAVSVGSDSACTLTALGGVECWGYNLLGDLGDNSTARNSLVPVAVSGLTSGVTAVATGSDSACAVTAGGTVVCWGVNESGQLGNSSSTTCSSGFNPFPCSLVPVPVTGLTGVTAVSVGYQSACAVAGGGVECWGSNGDGELGNSSDGGSSPVPVTGLTGVTAVSVGDHFACAVAAGGVECWGSNGDGELGNTSTAANSLSYVPVPVMGLTSGVTAVSAGFNSACAVTAGGAVVCWGGNDSGQLGNNSTTTPYSAAPVPVMGLMSGVTAVSVGFGSACAVTAGGTVVCWGGNGEGELGNNSDAGSSPVPVPVTGLTGVTAVSVGGNSACAVTAGGGIECWGSDGDGLLGNNEEKSSIPVPVPVAGF
jgi:alpha-tubulin suppressor-like RCC1 family protein